MELLNISFKQFIACTWGSAVSSFLDSLTGFRAKDLSSVKTVSKATCFELADRIPVIKAGIPADRLVVDTCSTIQDKAPL
jgi:hypothetical protein